MMDEGVNLYLAFVRQRRVGKSLESSVSVKATFSLRTEPFFGGIVY